VTRNLATALSAIRDLLSGAPCVLWADALSINQPDSAEKCQQIRLMSMIYKEADWVIGWLGESAEDSDYAMDLLERISEEMMIDEQASHSNLPTSLDLVGSSVQGEEIPS
jgi:Heterokaryon incompatibility protein (HET)